MRPGASGIVHPDGTIEGWVGGSCAQPVVVREALRALADGQPRLLRLSKDGPGEGRRGEGAHLLQQRLDATTEEAEHVVVARVDPGDVAAGAERPALAAEHEGAHPRLLGLVVRGVEFVEGALVEGVELVGAVERDDGDAVVDRELGHRELLVGQKS